ncbi:MAG: flippase-like domain-containing protein [Deltaproteobacteria bacterium]|nr:flippase-like domain-containing protein [Deltaproteobacteria bacterium]
MKKKIVIGVILGAVLLYLSFRGIRFQSVADGLKNIGYGYVIAALLIMFLIQAFRALRWGAILEPLEKVDQLLLFAVTNVGFLAIIAIPARLGELARPYLINQKTHITLSSALGTILIERLSDIFTIMLMLAVSLIFLSMPPWLVKPGILLFLTTMATTTTVVFMVMQPERSLRIIKRILGLLPDKYALLLNRFVSQLIDGLAVIKNPRCLLRIIFFSLIIWSINVLAIYLLFLAFGFDLSPVAAFILMVVLLVGITIPTAPGFIGNWHYFCILALGLFGIAKAEALTFAVVYHFLSVGIITILGLIFLPFYSFSLSNLRERDN